MESGNACCARWIRRWTGVSNAVLVFEVSGVGGGSVASNILRWELSSAPDSDELYFTAISTDAHHACRCDAGLSNSVSRLVSNNCRSVYASMSELVDWKRSRTSSRRSCWMRVRDVIESKA